MKGNAMAGGTHKPELETVKVGFLPLNDCASLVVAAELGFDRRYGINLALQRETSWAGVRDRLLNGGLDAAHLLYGMAYGIELGIGGRPAPMAVLMNLNRNGQAITLARSLVEQGAGGGAALARLMRARPRPYVFAQTFPTGDHAMLLNYWLSAHGIDPQRQARTLTVPPPQMVAGLRAGAMDGFCAGEPWGRRAVRDGVGVTVATSDQVWPDHPGKVLGVRAAFAARHPHTCAALVAALLDAGRWIDAAAANGQAAAELLAQPRYLNMDSGLIAAGLLGTAPDHGMQPGLDLELDRDAAPDCDRDPGAPGRLYFYGDGTVNFPYLSDGMWFLTQQRRWGLLKADPDYLAVAGAVNRVDLYRRAAELSGTPLPAGVTRRSTLIDGRVWDGSDPAAYAAGFPIRADV